MDHPDHAQQVAEATRDAMWKDDRASQGAGHADAGRRPRARRRCMTVREDMLNGHDICHGG
jgi:acyl-CoA thioesterase